MKKKYLLSLLMFIPILVFSQNNGKIAGKVVDNSKLPLIGANIIVLNTTNGAATDEDGSFEISITPGTYSVRAQFVGFSSQTIENVVVEAGKTTVIEFNLEMEALAAQEIVVIGYGVQKKTEVTGAVTSISPADVQKIPTTQIAEAIQGAAPGVNVSFGSGAPGSTPNIKIRGAGSLENNDPLYIIDGVPADIQYVNPADIEAIDILKDASSAAIYGSRAANGVILVTTKRGKPGDLKINYSTYLNSQSPDADFPFITNSRDYTNVAKQAMDNVGQDYLQFITDYEANPSAFSNSDWQNAYFRDAVEQKHDLSISGGTKDFNFSVSGLYANQKGTIINTDNERMSLRINSDFKKGRLKIGESFSVGKSKGTSRWNYTFNFFHLARMSPLTPIWDNTPSGYGTQWDISGLALEGNPILQNEINELTWDDVNILASGYLEYDILDDLKYTFRVSQNIDNKYEFNYFPEYFTSDADNNPTTNMDETRERQYHTIIETFANYNKAFGKHSFTLMGGYSQEKIDNRETFASVKGFPSTELRVLGAGEEGDNAGGDAWEWRQRSFFGRITYAFDDKYLVTANIRRDGSSRFDSENRWGTFPSFSLGWRLSKESFFEGIDFITDLKIRGGYGELGMQEFDDYAYIAKIIKDWNSRLNYPFGEGRDQGIIVGARALSFPSVGIQWETSKETNVGFDMALFGNRMTLTADYYQRESEGILYAAPIPLSSGSYSPPVVNSASIENNGLELGIGYRNYDNEFKYDINASISTYSNEVTKLGQGNEEAVWGGEIHWSMDLTTKTEVGQPIGSFFLYRTDGIFKSQAEIDAYTKDGNLIMPDAQPGDLKYVDVNGDGRISGDDKEFMGSGAPDAEFGVNFSARYKSFDISLNIYAVTGKQMINGARWLTMRLDKFAGMHEDLLDAWTPQNADSNIPRVLYADDRNAQASDYWLEDADYLRIRHIEIGYTFPKGILNALGVGNLRIYVAADNLITITGYDGYDPGIDYGSLFDRGADRSPYPVPKQFLTGIQLGL